MIIGLPPGLSSPSLQWRSASQPGALGNQAISTIAHEEGRISPALSFPSALAVPPAASMEAAGHAVAKTTGVGEPCTMIEAATYAMAEAAAESGDT